MSKEKINIDNLFKESLKGHSAVPSENVWNQLDAQLQKEGLYKSFVARNKRWAAVLLIFLTAAGAFWLFNNLSNDDTVQPSELLPEMVASDAPQSPAEPKVMLSESISMSEENTVPQKPNTSFDVTEVSETAAATVKETPLSEPAVISEPVNDNPDIISPVAVVVDPVIEPEESLTTKNIHKELLDEFRMQQHYNGSWYSLAQNNLNNQKYYTNSVTSTGMKQISDLTPWETFSIKPSYLCVGLNAGPEYLFYGEDQQNSGFGFGLDLYYNKSGLVLRSGAHLARYGDQGIYNVNYQRVDSLGYMYTVESFTIDPANPDSVIFNMKIEGVYDSVYVSEQAFTDAYYSYLQIPLMAGYTVSSYGNFSFDITAGPVLNLLVRENNPNPTVPVGENIYMGEVDNTSQPWIRTNLQLRASVAMHYRFSPHLRLAVEPIYNYYLSPFISDQSQNSSIPYSLSGRVGLLYKF